MGISKTNILAVAAATIIISGILLVSTINDNQEALAGTASTITCNYVFLPADPLELSVSVIPPFWFRTTVVNTDTLDCVHSETGPFVRDISIMITRDTNQNNQEKGTRITVITCDTKLFAKDPDPMTDPPGVIEPFCTKSTPSTTIGLHDTKCVPAKGVSFVETDSEWFYFTSPITDNVMIKSKTVTLIKSVLGCEPDEGEPTKFYDVFTMFELFGSQQFTTQLIIVCERGFNNNPGEIFGCEVGT